MQDKKIPVLPCLLAGAAAGFINGCFGAGGGMVLVPLLIRAAKLDTDDVYQQLALRLIRAVMSYDPEKGDLEQHIFAQLRMELQKTAHSNVISLDVYRMRDAA